MAEDERFPVKLFPTATATDVLFYVVVGRLDKRKIPEYGTRYNDITPRSEDWPHHRLVHISSPDANGKQKWFFAADRENEDIYNWTLGQGEELIRTYLVRRDLYLQRSAVEAAALPKQSGEFTHPVVATLDSKFTKYGFADDTVLDAPDELKSLYIVVKRRFMRPSVSEISYDENLGIRIKTTMTLVPATTTEVNLPVDTLGVVYELQPVNTFHSIQVKREVVPESNGWTLADYYHPQAIRTNIPNLPSELISVNVVWNSQYSVGTQDYTFFKMVVDNSFTLDKNASDEASSSASITPEIQLHFRDVEASNLPAYQCEIFIAGDATESAVVARLTALAGGTPVLAWPVFRPESKTITTTGQSINVRSNVGISLDGTMSNNVLTAYGYDRKTSDDFTVNLSVGSVQLPACIHGAVTFTDAATRSQAVSATAFMAMTNSLVGSISATKTKSGTAYGRVSPTSLAPVAGATSIPTTGLYALEIRPGGNFMGYTRVVATVLDAAHLA